MQKQIIQAHPYAPVSVQVIWLPMVPTDSERAARAAGLMFADRRVHQYYDADKHAGSRVMQEAFDGCLEQAVEATPNDHPIHEMLADRMVHSEQIQVLWDVVLFYPPGIEWTGNMPGPLLWSKQIGFWGGEEGSNTGEFYKNDCRQGPVTSDWHIEVREAMGRLLRARLSGAVQLKNKAGGGL